MAPDTSSTEYRVRFDFEIDFTNGGGIQGQDFRLDIVGDGISDEDLAERIVRELRLLMVGGVRIRNKQILPERHKRGRSASTAPSSRDGRVRIDLSHPIELEVLIGSRRAGTSIDAPRQSHPGGADLAVLPLEGVADLDGVMIDVTGSTSRAVTRSQLVPYELTGRAVLVHTGWARHWGSPHYLAKDHPFLTPEAAAYLVEQRVSLVGIDAPNVDDTSRDERPTHTLLHDAGIPVCQHLANLERLPVEGFRFSAVPAPIRNLGTFLVRAHAVLG